MMSPMTRTTSPREPLLVEMERFSLKYNLSAAEKNLVDSCCEALREEMLASDFRTMLKRLDISGAARCLQHPIRLGRGVYFAARKATQWNRRTRAFAEMEIPAT